MPFTDSGKFYHDRRIEQLGDTWKIAAERLAKHIETFLYAEDDPGYLKPEFLAWSLSVYDATKNSTGNVDITPFDDELMKLEPMKGASEAPFARLDKSIRFDKNARESKTVDTDEHAAADMVHEGSPLHSLSDLPESMSDESKDKS